MTLWEVLETVYDGCAKIARSDDEAMRLATATAPRVLVRIGAGAALVRLAHLEGAW